ncbi:MAG: GNAT family N-acetyltransferase [Firmicutes bacterium]|nr:GNAT family N-acetyltransferase [Bacillota bacterium]
MQIKSNIIVRDFLLSDKEAFLTLAIEFYNSDAVCHSIEIKNIELTFEACLNRSPYARGFIIEYDSEPAGFALLSFMHSLEAGGLVVLLEDLYVSQKFRGKGLMSKFFKVLFNEYDNKIARYRLEVTKNNKNAIDIYKHYGFSELEYLAMVKDL